MQNTPRDPVILNSVQGGGAPLNRQRGCVVRESLKRKALASDPGLIVSEAPIAAATPTPTTT